MVDHLVGDKGIAHWLFVEHFKEYDKWPWMRVTDFAKQWEEHTSFVVCECTFFLLVSVSFSHAFFTADPQNSRRLKLMWIATFIVGTVNDYIFMLLPVCDNFWQAQGLVMLTPRMPLYIPCVYNAFMYWPLVAASRVFHHSNKCRISEACLCGLLGGLFYAPYDVNGARFLWWTWHDSDPPIALRWLGVPAGSTAWTITFNFCLAYLLRVGYDKGWGQLQTLLLACLSTPMMIVVLNIFIALGMDKATIPGVRTLLVTILFFTGVVFYRFALPQRSAYPLPKSEPLVVKLAMLFYFTSLCACMAIFDPERVVSSGAHQVYGPCDKQDVDMMLMPRNRYICDERYEAGWQPDEKVVPESRLDRKFPNKWYFKFDCPTELPGAVGRYKHTTPQEGLKVDPDDPEKKVTSWFTVCGQPHENWPLWMGAVASLTGTGAVLFVWVFGVSGTVAGKPKTL